VSHASLGAAQVHRRRLSSTTLEAQLGGGQPRSLSASTCIQSNPRSAFSTMPDCAAENIVEHVRPVNLEPPRAAALEPLLQVLTVLTEQIQR